MALHFAAQGLLVLLRMLRSFFHCANFQESESVTLYAKETPCPEAEVESLGPMDQLKEDLRKTLYYEPIRG